MKRVASWPSSAHGALRLMTGRHDVVPTPGLARPLTCVYNWRHVGRHMVRFVGVRELRNQTGKVLDAVRRGERVV
ncbi:MAG TPA: hypothetical protein VGQ17_06350, partial [Gemmatimonadales bacterium]|nr:hypothetical protein [Gemmatimonadales bacterium]